MKKMLVFVSGLLVTLNMVVGLTASASSLPPVVPQIISPESAQVLTNYPREAHIQWTAVTGALGYDVEITCDYCNSTTTKWSNPNYYYSIPNTYYDTLALAGDHEFRVRVRAYFNYEPYNGNWSDYRYFSYNTGSTSVLKAVADSYNFEREGLYDSSAFYMDVIQNDTYPDFSRLNLTVSTTPLHGTATATSAKKISYTPYSGYVGYDDFQYEISYYDNNGKYYSSKVWSTVNTKLKANPLIVIEDNFNFDKIGEYNGTAYYYMDVLKNDTYPDLSKLNVKVSLVPLYGKAEITSDKKITYTPYSSFYGYDDFKYLISYSDGVNTFNSEGWVKVNIKANDIIQKENVKCVFQGSAKKESCYLAGENDKYKCSGVDSCTIPVSEKSKTSLTWKSSCGGYAYTYVDGSDEYAYFICNTSASVVAGADNYSFTRNDAWDDTKYILGVLNNDTYPNDVVLTVALTPLHGTAKIDGKNIRYIPTAGYVGYDDFQYKISTADGGYSSTAWVSVTTTATTSTVLKAANDNFTAAKSNASDKTEFSINVLGNDTFQSIGPVLITASPLHGSAYVNPANQQILYTPTPGYTGYDDFQYKITDSSSSAKTSLAWVYVNVTAKNTVMVKVPPAGYEYPVDPVTGYTNPFSDMDSSSPEGQAAIYLYHNAIIGGYEDGTFKTNNLVNRAEISKFVANALYKGKVKKYVQSDNKGLADLILGQWYYDYVAAMLEASIFDGYPDKTFKAGSYINAAELSKVLVNAFKLKINYNANHGSYFKDVSSADWYAPFAYTVVADYKLFPNRTSYFNGGTYVTRGELAYAIYQIMTKYK